MCSDIFKKDNIPAMKIKYNIIAQFDVLVLNSWTGFYQNLTSVLIKTLISQLWLHKFITPNFSIMHKIMTWSIKSCRLQWQRFLISLVFTRYNPMSHNILALYHNIALVVSGYTISGLTTFVVINSGKIELIW